MCVQVSVLHHEQQHRLRGHKTRCGAHRGLHRRQLITVAVSVCNDILLVLSGAAVHDAGGAPGSVVRLLLLRGLHLMLHQN